MPLQENPCAKLMLLFGNSVILLLKYVFLSTIKVEYKDLNKSNKAVNKYQLWLMKLWCN